MSEQPNPDGITMRELRPADLAGDYPAVTGLWTEAGLSFRPQGRDRIERVAIELERGSACFLLAEEAGRLVGVVIGTHDGRKGWINRLAVAPAYRRRGIAARLVREVEDRLATTGIEINAALIESPNVASLAFFCSIGYIHDPHIEYVSKRRSAET